MALTLTNQSDTSVIGGSGGRPFVDTGRGAQVLVGFDVYSGNWIDAIVPIFSEVTLPGFGGEDLGGHYGGSGGSVRRLLPPRSANFAVVEVVVRYGWYVDSLRVTWEEFNNGAPTGNLHTDIAGGSGGLASVKLSLQKGFVAVGVHGRCDRWLDAIGLKGAQIINI